MIRRVLLLSLLFLFACGLSAQSGISDVYSVRNAVPDDAPDHPSKDPDLILQKAFYARVQGDSKAAFTYFREYFATGKESAYARSEYARFLTSVPGKEALTLALEEADKASRLQPDNEEHVILKTEILRRGGRSDLAFQTASEFLIRHPENTETEFYLAESLNDQKKFSEALFHYRRVLFAAQNTGSKSAFFRNSALWRISHILLLRNRPDLAEPFLSEYVKLNPERLYPRYVLSVNIYLINKEIDPAGPHLDFLAEQSPETLRKEGIDPAVVHSAHAQVLFLQASPLAGRALLEAMKYNPGSLLLNGMWYAYIGKPVQALRLLIPYLKKNQGYIPALVAVLQSVEELGEREPGSLEKELLKMSQIAAQQNMHLLGLDFAYRAQSRIADRESESGDSFPVKMHQVYYHLSLHHLALKRNARSLVYIRRALETAPAEFQDPYKAQLIQVLLSVNTDNSRNEAYRTAVSLLSGNEADGALYFVKGILELSDMKQEDALSSFTEAINRKPEIVLSFLMRAQLHEYNNDEESKLRDLNQALVRSPENPQVLNSLAYHYAEKGENLNQAKHMLNKAIESDPFNPAYADSLGWVYHKSGDQHMGLLWLQYARKLMESEGKKIPVIYEHLAAAQLARNEKESALEYIEKGLYAASWDKPDLTAAEIRENRQSEERLKKMKEGLK